MIIDYEHRRQRPLSRSQFLQRLFRRAGFAALFIGGALGIGIVGYHQLEQLSWTDSFLNASMILGGMGPVNEMKTEAGKIFAGSYALFSGLVFIAVTGMLLTPFAHRLLHRFHYDSDK
ncbi:MAG: hypothetical protein CFE26_11480 [Verrucomicrobiales bacterium VVV1]|nr:MAG: hypothetical protein CFE26_11480 [Verrucomicrobiales bacterium VVV1]